MTTPDGLLFCRGCGGKIQPTTSVCPHCGCLQPGQTVDQGRQNSVSGQAGYAMNASGQAAPSMGFGKAITTCLRKYAVFKGRATRPEYWYFYLFSLLVSIAATILMVPKALNGLLSLALLLPSIAAATRRLHDMGRSGWNQLWALTIIGIIPLVYWQTRPGNPGPNRFGPPPTA